MTLAIGAGELPILWRPMRLKHLAIFESGEAITAESIESDGAYPVYGGNGLRGYTSTFTHEGRFPLIGRQGALCGNVNLADGQFWASEHAIVVAVSGDVDVRWMGDLLGALNLGQYSQSAAQPGLSVEVVQNLVVPTPPLSEQRAIADYLDAETVRIDQLMGRYRERIDLLGVQRRAFVHAGVAGTPIEAAKKASILPWLTEVPIHWDEVKVSLLARLGSGHTPSRQNPEWWVECTIPWITTGEVWQVRDDRIEYLTETRESISEIGLANSAAELHPAGTVVLSRTASAGFSAIMGRDMATSQDFVTWTFGPQLRPLFLLLCLRAMRADLLGRLAMGSTHKTIYVPDIQSIRIPVPPIDEQDEIVEWVWDRIRALDRVLDITQRQIDLLTERRQALITAAVTGQLDIPGVAA